MNRPLVAVVLAGGTGTRLYPASRPARPKQFYSFGDERSVLSQTVDRVGFADETYVVTRPAYRAAVGDHAPDATILTEPAPRDTGPSLVYATHRIREQVGDCVLVVVPCDQYVDGEFQASVEQAAQAAVETEGVVTIGIEPTRPETGYGYIEPGEDFDGYRTVEQFHEKPDQSRASAYIDRNFYWNAGIFVWTPDAFVREARNSPLEPLVTALETGNEERAFDTVDAVSVDCAVLERSNSVSVVPADFEWDDLGSWESLERVFGVDGDENTTFGETVSIDASGNVVATDGHVSLVGVEDLVVASYGDRTLVVPKSDAQRVREVVSRLRETDAF